MAKDPAFLFYSSDFLTGTMFMSDEQVGKYIRLLCAQHQNGRITPAQMHRLCHGNADAEILEKFDRDDKGNFFNARLEEEIEKRSQYSEKQSERAKKRWKKTNTDALPSESDGNAVAMPKIEDENENENKDKNKGVVGEKNKKPKKPDLILDHCPPHLLKGLELWLPYKAEKRQKYTQRGIETAFTLWARDYPTEDAFISAVRFSMSQNWSGIFPPKNQINQKTNTNGPIPRDQRDDALANWSL